jgi:hypothetical protein
MPDAIGTVGLNHVRHISAAAGADQLCVRGTASWTALHAATNDTSPAAVVLNHGDASTPRGRLNLRESAATRKRC